MHEMQLGKLFRTIFFTNSLISHKLNSIAYRDIYQIYPQMLMIFIGKFKKQPSKSLLGICGILELAKRTASSFKLNTQQF